MSRLLLCVASLALTGCLAEAPSEPSPSESTAESSDSQPISEQPALNRTCSAEINAGPPCAGKQFLTGCTAGGKSGQCQPVSENPDASWNCICSQQSVM